MTKLTDTISSLALLRSFILVCIAMFSVSSCAYSDADETSKQAIVESELLGVISKDQLNHNFSKFAQNYEEYQPSEQELQAVANLSDSVSLTVFFGSWCHDSEREVPRLLKVYNNSSTDIKLVSLDMQKSDPEQLAQSSNIKFTPTILVFNNGQEIGRVIERPKQSLAQDIFKIWQDSPSQ